MYRSRGLCRPGGKRSEGGPHREGDLLFSGGGASYFSNGENGALWRIASTCDRAETSSSVSEGTRR